MAEIIEKEKNVDGLKIISSIPADIVLAAIGHGKGNEIETHMQITGKTTELMSLYVNITQALADSLYDDLKADVKDKVTTVCDTIARAAAIGLGEFEVHKANGENE